MFLKKSLASTVDFVKAVRETPRKLLLAYTTIAAIMICIPLLDVTASTTSTLIASAFSEKTFHWFKGGGLLLAGWVNPALLPLLVLQVIDFRSQEKNDLISRLVRKHHSVLATTICGSYFYAFSWSGNEHFLLALFGCAVASILADWVGAKKSGGGNNA